MAEAQKLGIDNLKKVFALLAGIASVGDKVGHDTDWAKRATDLVGLYIPLQNVMGLDWKQVLPEAKDLDAAEQVELVQVIDSNLTLMDQALEAQIEKLIDAAEKIAESIENAIGAVKSLKAA